LVGEQFRENSGSRGLAGDRRTVYHARTRDTACANAWEEARLDAGERLEEEARRRAHDGLVRHKFDWKGKPLIQAREASDVFAGPVGRRRRVAMRRRSWWPGRTSRSGRSTTNDASPPRRSNSGLGFSQTLGLPMGILGKPVVLGRRVFPPFPRLSAPRSPKTRNGLWIALSPLSRFSA